MTLKEIWRNKLDCAYTIETGKVDFHNAWLLYVSLQNMFRRQIQSHTWDGLPGSVRDVQTTVEDEDAHRIHERRFVTQTWSTTQIIALYLPDARNN